MKPFAPAAGPRSVQHDNAVRVDPDLCVRDGCRNRTSWGLCEPCAAVLRTDPKATR